MVGLLQEVYEKEARIVLDFSKLSRELRTVDADVVDKCQKNMQKMIDDLHKKILMMSNNIPVIMFICYESESIASDCLNKGGPCCLVISLTCK